MESQTFGSDADGFSIGPGAVGDTIQIRVWGFWSDGTAEKFAGVVISTCAGGNRAIVTIDAGDLKPLRDTGQRAVGAVVASLPAYKVKRVVITKAGALTRLQLLRIVKERATESLVEFGT